MNIGWIVLFWQNELNEEDSSAIEIEISQNIDAILTENVPVASTSGEKRRNTDDKEGNEKKKHFTTDYLKMLQSQIDVSKETLNNKNALLELKEREVNALEKMSNAIEKASEAQQRESEAKIEFFKFMMLSKQW